MVAKVLSSWTALLKSICFLNFIEYIRTSPHTPSTLPKKQASCSCVTLFITIASGHLSWSELSSYAL